MITKANRFDMWAVLVILLTNFVVYFPSLFCYFLADDFIHVAYLHHIFEKQPLLVLSNFCTNWMEATGTQFYRPLVSLTLAFDYLIWRDNAFGFHLSNLFFHAASSVLLYFVFREMTNTFEGKVSKAFSTLAAVFFSTYPLHSEVISWVIGRVDSIATAFYLAAMLLFLRSSHLVNSKRYLSFRLWSLAFYFSGMLSKEIAVTLPLVLWIWLFLQKEAGSYYRRIFIATKCTLSYWLLLLIYFFVRVAVLGTPLGGYSGSLGACLNLGLVIRICNLADFLRLIFPFNDLLFSQNSVLRWLLAIAYCITAFLFVLRWINKTVYMVPWRLICFSLIWFLISILPALQVLTLGGNLEGSRIFYLASAPICFLLSLISVPVFKSKNDNIPHAIQENSNRLRSEIYMNKFCTATIAIVLLSIAYINNLPWLFASNEIKALSKAVVTEEESLLPDEKLILLNVPTDLAGAHMLYNGATTRIAMSLAIPNHRINCPLVTFEPVLYGDADLINVSRLERLLKSKDYYKVFVWQRGSLQGHLSLKEIFHHLFVRNFQYGHLKKIETNDLYVQNKPLWSLLFMKHIVSFGNKRCPYKIITVSNISINSKENRLLELSIRACPVNSENQPASLALRWLANKPSVYNTGSMVEPLIVDGKAHKYLFNVGQHKSWLLADLIRELQITGSPGNYRMELERMSFVDPGAIIPRLDYCDKQTEDDSGVCHNSEKKAFCFKYDASGIKGASSIAYEVSQPNFWFEHESGTFTRATLSKNSVASEKKSKIVGDIQIDSKKLGEGYFEVDLAALDKNKNLLGLTSYPLCGQISR